MKMSHTVRREEMRMWSRGKRQKEFGWGFMLGLCQMIFREIRQCRIRQCAELWFAEEIWAEALEQ